MLAIYTFVFSEVFKARWSAVSTSKAEFAMVLFAGPPSSTSLPTVPIAHRAILSNPNYVKKVVYPLEILPVISLGAAFFSYFGQSAGLACCLTAFFWSAAGNRTLSSLCASAIHTLCPRFELVSRLTRRLLRMSPSSSALSRRR